MANAAMPENDLQPRVDGALREVDQLRAENERLRTLLKLAQRTKTILDPSKPEPPPSGPGSPASADEKVALVRRLFRGRDDVYALRWESTRTGKSGYAPATAEGWSRHGPKTYLPISDEAIARHLRGRESIGVYPLLADDTCWFLACDLDGATWQLDALALLEVCDEYGVPVALERSRSGAGGHVWVFFTAPVAASVARRLGALLLRAAMSRRGELDLASYDRLFPNQDFLPAKGFGNLIALPLQGRCRAVGTSVFLDPATLEPWPDQWAFLNSLERVTPERLQWLLSEHEEIAVGAAALSPQRTLLRDERLAAEIRCTIGADLAIARADLPPSLLAELKHLASLHNPLFYERQRLRLSTHQTPRLIRCYEENLTHLRLPRGLLHQVEDAAAIAGSRLVTDDRRPTHPLLPLAFHGELTPLQASAAAAMLAHDAGVLVAPPGTGKTVIACALIAERKLPTLVLAHSKPLLEQWRAQLATLLNLSSKQIGQKGGGRRKLTGIVDLAMIQSLKAIDDLDAFFGDYGLIVIDECHHLPAFSFEAAVRHAPARHFLGLTATPYRRDGLQEIVTMQCGPIRHRIASSESPAGEISLSLIVRETGLAFADAAEQPIHEVFRLLVEDEQRTTLVCDDVRAALAGGRRCLVLSQWKQHCHALAERLQDRGVSPLVLEGGLGKRARAALLAQIENTPADEPLVVIATGQYLGEGFDCPQLDTLFLAFPISFKGRLVQYTGRLMRAHDGKATIHVYDYADLRVPVLRAMHARRLTTYKTLGFAREQQTLPAVAA
ncbi:MAG TPA: DEAD/DEAH box helicase family protein [Gaiellaceae bacterium]|nr:DEAD/DEAH box helicase family protein [Gaiellaceae bacterium]